MSFTARVEKIMEKPEVQYDKKKRPVVSLMNLTTLLAGSEQWKFQAPGAIAGGRKHRLAFDVMKDCVVTLAAPLWPLELQDLSNPPQPGPWSEADTKKLRYWFEKEHDINVTAKLCEEIVDLVARRQTYDPVRAHLKGLVWDGVPRLERWLTDYLGAVDTPYHRAVGRCWLISSIARALRPGCKVDSLIVLEGPQGKGKSTALSILGGEHYTDQVSPLGTKDASADLRGTWIIELGELSALNRSEIETVKAYASRQTDRYRPAYGRIVKEYPRTCVFAGTTNSSGYLKDSTGARRFWPVKTGLINLVALRRDRDQLLAEAKALFERGDKWHLTEEENALAKEEQAERTERDVWHDEIVEKIGTQTFVTVADLLGQMGIQTAARGTQESRRVVHILQSLGWAQGTRKTKGVLIRGWVPPEEPKVTSKRNDVTDVPPVMYTSNPSNTQDNSSKVTSNTSDTSKKKEEKVQGVPREKVQERKTDVTDVSDVPDDELDESATEFAPWN